MGKKKIVIDTNLFISALGWGGTPKALLDKVIQEEYELYMSERQLEEIKTVLDFPKFNFTTDQKERFLLVLSEITHILKTEEITGVLDDPKDHIILEPAVTKKIDYIITGDDDLLRLGTFRKALILKASDFLKKEPTQPFAEHTKPLKMAAKRAGLKEKDVPDIVHKARKQRAR